MSGVPKDFDHSKLSGSDKSYLKDIKFDQSLAMSPVEKPRRCTDIICCMIFTATVVGMMICTVYGYAEGAPWKLLAPIDGDGRICGYTSGVEDYTHLYIGNIDEAAQPSNVMDVFTYGVCVKECPSATNEVISCVPTKQVTSCQPAAGEAYITYDIFSYCAPEYDSLPASVQ